MLQILHHPAYYKDGAFLPAPAFPPTVPILQEGRAAFPPHAKRGGNGQPAHIPPSKQKTL